MDLQKVQQKIADAEFVLAGIGEEWSAGDSPERVEQAYERLGKLLEGKDYFIVTTLEDGLVFDSALAGERIAAPFAGENAPEGSSEERWQTYMRWLMGTLNRKLFMLELGEGFEKPSVIRWPFEKTACLNLKSYLWRVHRRFYQLPDGLDGRGKGEAADSVRWILSEEAFC